MRFDAEPGDPKFGMLFPCICTTERQQEKRSRELNNLSNLESLRHLTFESFDGNQRGTDSAFRIAREYARTTDGWLVLHGGVGVGKTHLAAAIANLAVLCAGKIPVNLNFTAGKAAVEHRCTDCHELDEIDAHGGDDVAGWSKVIADMVAAEDGPGTEGRGNPLQAQPRGNDPRPGAIVVGGRRSSQAAVPWLSLRPFLQITMA